MDGSGCPYLVVIILIAIVLVLAVALGVVLYTFRDHIFKRAKNIITGEKLTDEDVEEEIISIMNEGMEQGVLLDSEIEMIHNIFEFGEKEVKDIMIHRTAVLALDGNMSYYDAVRIFGEAGRSRYPIYDEDIDNIIGVLHIKDAFSFAQRNEIFRTPLKEIPGLIRDVEFVPETLNIDALFKKMRAKKNHLCVVVDEYGQTSGIVAMEDILEEIVGDIEDEHDEEEDEVELQSDGSYTLEGLTEFRDLLDVLDLPLDEDAFETVNGFLISLIEKIPVDGEQYVVNEHGYQFEITSVEDRIIKEVRITKCDAI